MIPPTHLILNVREQVQRLERTLQATGPIWETPEELYRELVAVAQDPGSCYAKLLEVIARVKHSQVRYMPDHHLNKVVIAIGDLGIAIIRWLEYLRLHDAGDVLPYRLDRVWNHDFVLTSLKSRHATH
jgi:hypothetical protein